jgi:hypothetical protein
MRKGDFNEFGGHTQGGSHHHPEQGCRSAQVYSKRYPGDVAGTHRPRKGGRECLKVGSISLVTLPVEFPPDNPQRIFQVPELGKSQINGEEQAGSEKKKNKPLGASNITIDDSQVVVEFLHEPFFQKFGLKIAFSTNLKNHMGQKYQPTDKKQD